jgi:hypothetical protein
MERRDFVRLSALRGLEFLIDHASSSLGIAGGYSSILSTLLDTFPAHNGLNIFVFELVTACLFQLNLDS